VEGREGKDFAKSNKCHTSTQKDLARLLHSPTGAQARFRNFRTSTTGACGAKKKFEKSQMRMRIILIWQAKKKMSANRQTDFLKNVCLGIFFR